MTDGKTVKVELYPYFSKESKKDDSDRNHLRHELFYNCSKESRKDESLKGNWELLDDPEFETEGHIHFFSKNNAWELINQKTIEYLLSLGICDIEKIEEL
ncbi:MAG: hypothetical protein N4A49_06775 [Marinifilaceae bacterium]|nr:hypothetical protein [Marinifilaceae bacterium]